MIRVGIPFIVFMVGGLYGSAYMFEKKFEASAAEKTNVTLEERTRRHVKKRKVDVAEEHARLLASRRDAGSDYVNIPVPKSGAPRSL